MLKLSCKDLNPSSDCDFEVTGETAPEVAQKMMAHAKEMHLADLEKMNMTDEEKMQFMESKVHQA